MKNTLLLFTFLVTPLLIALDSDTESQGDSNTFDTENFTRKAIVASTAATASCSAVALLSVALIQAAIDGEFGTTSLILSLCSSGCIGMAGSCAFGCYLSYKNNNY